MKIQFKFAASALAVVLFAGCAAKTEPATNTVPDAATATNTATATVSDKPFRVAFNQWIGFTGVMLAREKGYFKGAGLNVDWKEFSGPADGMAPLIAGQLDAALTTADTPILLSRDSNSNPLMNVYAIDNSRGADGIVAQKGIATVADLKGKTVAATKGQINEFLLLKALEKSGLKPTDVTITNMDADAGGAAVLADKVPAAVTWEPWLSKATAAGGKVIFSSKEVPDLILDVATVGKSVAAARPADVKAFVAAIAKGNAEALANPTEAAKIAKKYFGVDEKEATAMLGKVKLYSAAENATLMGSADKPGVAAKTSKEIADFFVAQKVMEQPPVKADLFTPEFLPTP